jgi:hypothetical protein
MASMKILSGDYMLEVSFNEDYRDSLIQKCDIINQVKVKGMNLSRNLRFWLSPSTAFKLLI